MFLTREEGLRETLLIKKMFLVAKSICESS